MHAQQILEALAFALVYVTGIIAILCFWVWIFWQYYKALHPDKRWRLASKIWYCKQCWYYAYMQKTTECPKCAKRYQQGEHWIVVEELARGQPKNVSYYEAMQRMCMTESDD